MKTAIGRSFGLATSTVTHAHDKNLRPTDALPPSCDHHTLDGYRATKLKHVRHRQHLLLRFVRIFESEVLAANVVRVRGAPTEQANGFASKAGHLPTPFAVGFCGDPEWPA